MSKVCLTKGQISWQSKFLYNKEGTSITLAFMIIFFPCPSRTMLAWNPICLSQSQSYRRATPFITAVRQSYIRQGETAEVYPPLSRGHIPDGHVVWFASLWQHPLLLSQALQPSRKWDGSVMLWSQSGGSSPPALVMWSVKDPYCHALLVSIRPRQELL